MWKKQKFFFDFVKENDIKVICLQEHNLKNSHDLLDIFYENFHVIINESILLKGGMCILADKTGINSKIISIEKSANARITSVKFSIDDTCLHILNLYAPSGTKKPQRKGKYVQI